ncbi:pyridoxamine 5'-phosphate oxidase family protein [Actinoplanes sp. CA-142083]|uniref:pyridoxamine 5'-phosphate oxidase family protein n=1 Tax=Actinoplanes sp. CA-142083 TaxID=3239903 RepID=UPI003D91671E
MSFALGPGTDLAATIDAYRTCELATIGKDGTAMAWPTSGLTRPDGTFLLTTSIAYPQKAYNIRRDSRVALLFSDPTASGLDRPEQILVQGKATCSDEVHVEPEGDLADFWARLFERQPTCRKYLDWPATMLTDFYFMRLMIRVTPIDITRRPLPGPAAPGPGSGLIGGAVLPAYASVVLSARDEAGGPTLTRTTVVAEGDAWRVAVPEDVEVAAGPASLLVHRHDDQLWSLHNANVVGTLMADDKGWLLRPARLIEPGGRHRASLADPIRTVRDCRATTKRYLERRNLARPKIPWAAYRSLRAGL